MPLFGSSSSSKKYTTNNNSDERQIADNGGVAINSGGGEVIFSSVPDEAFELAEFAIGNSNLALAETAQSFERALMNTQKTSRTEGAQLGEILIMLGVPALALVFIVGAFRNG